ncbi:8692_t:CDS:2 [Diversispora eburnea]|uniref:8692_t:CDS:1 n=1 Tax=Diversispora eburnea TaxID=1213867 RepID=A0A9N8VPV2_9GLOM|nr:8692_t:CDS:2 [Diversispora eburnea]
MDLIFHSYSQVQILEKLISVQKRLENLSIVNHGRETSSIGQFTSLQELYIEDCDGLFKLGCLYFASSFTLSSFRPSYRFIEYPQEFIVKILVTANTNLKEICLDFYPTISSDIFSAVLNMVKRFSFGNEKESGENNSLCQMAENMPNSLETVEIIMCMFSADSLRKFFEGWCCKGGGGNKNMIIKCLESRSLNYEHWRVIEEYGVQFYIEYIEY